MATEALVVGVKSYPLDNLQKQWITVALQVKRAQLVRARVKEHPGSEIYALRGKEIAAVDALLGMF